MWIDSAQHRRHHVALVTLLHTLPNANSLPGQTAVKNAVTVVSTEIITRKRLDAGGLVLSYPRNYPVEADET